MCPPGLYQAINHGIYFQELQAQLEEEVRSHEEHREELAAMERRCVLLVSEGEETHAALESAEKARKAMETELQDACEKYSDLSNQVLPPLLLESSPKNYNTFALSSHFNSRR